MSRLFSSLVVDGLSLKNRIVMPPMASETATEEGMATDETFDYYEKRARGGVGLLIAEHTYVLKGGKRSARQLGIYSGEHVSRLSELVRRVHSYGAAVGIQLTHAGAAARREITGEHPVAPSPVPLPGDETVPLGIPREDIPLLAGAFVEGALRAKAAGFDVIELHGAHGYLLNQFFSPLTNRRTDEYGGSRERRMRFILEVVEAVRSAVGPAMVLFYRLGADDGLPGGLTIDDARYAAPRLVEAGVNVIDVSGGLSGSGRDRLSGQGYFAPLSQAIKEVVEVPVMVAGGITLPHAAEAIIREGKADLVGIGRALLADPNWATKAREVLGS